MRTPDKGRHNPAASILAALALACCILLVPGFLGWLHPALDSFSHFRMHLAVLLVLLALPLLATRFRREGIVAVVLAAAAIASAVLKPEIYRVEGEEPTVRTQTYRLMQMNLRFDNQTPERVSALIATGQPDVLTLEEVSDMWLPHLERLRAAFPHQLVCASKAKIGGVAILSRHPFVESNLPDCVSNGRLGVKTIDFGGRPVDIGALHFGWPWPFDQASNLASVSQRLSSLGPTALVAGDFNAVTWSETVRKAARTGGMRIVGGVGPTWIWHDLPVSLARLVGLPLDHALAKGRFETLSGSTGSDSGSDHLPVIVDFTLPPAPTERQAMR